jgi:hypothetical protein
MVYDKKKSGDPDYDDKVPAEQHGAKVVRAGDGTEVYMTESNGPVNAFGAHVNLDEPADAGDNRPAPGDVATEASTAQVPATDPPEADAKDDKPDDTDEQSSDKIETEDVPRPRPSVRRGK